MSSLNDSQFLAVSLIEFYLGAFVFIALAAKGRVAFAFGAAVGVVAAFLTASAFEPDMHLGKILLTALLGAALGVAAILLCYGAFALVSKLWDDFIPNIRKALRPSEWSPDATEPAPQDIARRWFVAVGAITGSVVFSLATFPEFLEGLESTFSPGMIFGVAVAAAASTILEGPMHEFVMGHHSEAAGEEKMPAFSFDSMTLRGWLRLALLGGFFLALALLFNSLEESVSAASNTAAVTILVVGYTPGVVSYYWSAALQQGLDAPGLRNKSTYSSWVAGNALYYPWGALLVLSVGLLFLLPAVQTGTSSDPKSILVFVIIAPFLGLLPAMLLSALTMVLPALAGGWVIERLTGWKAMAGLVVALGLANLVPGILISFVLMAAHVEGDPTLLPYLMIGAAGWVFGLVASGFPQLVQKKTLRAAGAAA